jgi:hypothetical protein
MCRHARHLEHGSALCAEGLHDAECSVIVRTKQRTELRNAL